jgi:hypothetical protein
VKNSTHYFFSLGLSNLYLLNNQGNDPIISRISVVLSLFCSIVSILPNFLDQQVSIKYEYEGVQLPRYRHPLSHSPWTVFYFFPLLYLGEVTGVIFIQIVAVLLVISWLSHLFLDLLNPGGIPIGKGAIFNNHPLKHYQFMLTSRKHRRLRLARIPFNDVKANRNFGYIGLFLFSLNLATIFLTFLRGF